MEIFPFSKLARRNIIACCWQLCVRFGGLFQKPWIKPRKIRKTLKKSDEILVFGCFRSALAGYKHYIIETVPVDTRSPTPVEVHKTLMFNKISIVSTGKGFWSSTVCSWPHIPMCQNTKVLKNTAGETIREIAAGEAAGFLSDDSGLVGSRSVKNTVRLHSGKVT